MCVRSENIGNCHVPSQRAQDLLPERLHKLGMRPCHMINLRIHPWLIWSYLGLEIYVAWIPNVGCLCNRILSAAFGSLLISQLANASVMVSTFLYIILCAPLSASGEP
eukprot:885932-Prymnesium_polylepis.3